SSPREYPIEAAALMSIIAECFDIAYGVSRFLIGGTGFTPIVVGAIALWSYGHILFGKEKGNEDEKQKSDSLPFNASESQAVGWTGKIRQKLKGNPVFTSSLVGAAICTIIIAGGIAEGLPVYAFAGVVFMAANILQALLVSKKGFNIE